MENRKSDSLGLILLLITFVVLKLTGVIAWSWWWVLSPFWIPLGIASVIFLYFTIRYLLSRA